MKQGDAKKQGAGEVLTTGGEASAAGYAEATVPAGTESPTIDLARVRVVPPSQTPTVRVGDVVKGAGPRAPEQRVKPKPKGLVELPEGRPVTKMQLIEIDPEFLLGLEQGLIENDAEGAAETSEGTGVAAQVGAEASGGRVESPWVKEAGAAGAAEELPSAGAAPAVPASEPAKRRGPSEIVMGVAVAATVVVGVIVAMVLRRGPEPIAKGSAMVTPSATATAEAAATVSPTAASPSTTATPTANAAPSVVPSAAAPAPHPTRKSSSPSDDPYDDASTPLPKKKVVEAPPTAPPAPLPSSNKTTTPALPGGDKTEF